MAPEVQRHPFGSQGPRTTESWSLNEAAVANESFRDMSCARMLWTGASAARVLQPKGCAQGTGGLKGAARKAPRNLH